MNDVQKARYDRFFSAYEDTGGNITRESILAHAERLAEVRREDASSPAVEALRNELLVSWNVMAEVGDMDGDGAISREEFYAAGERLSGFLAQFDGPAKDGPLGAWIESLFGVIDADGDGRITKAEYADWLTALGLADDTDVDAAFAGFDKNQDGTLSREEFAECGHQFWTIFDANVPGARWIGP